jgi:hypothetical protein
MQHCSGCDVPVAEAAERFGAARLDVAIYHHKWSVDFCRPLVRARLA